MSTVVPASRLSYTFPVERLKRGHSFGNALIYVTLDAVSDVISEPHSARLGLRDAYDQKYYLYGWKVGLNSADGTAATAVDTTFLPASQITNLRLGRARVAKKFLLPYENNLLRSAHYVFEANAGLKNWMLQSRAIFPEGTKLTQEDQNGHAYLSIQYVNGTVAVIWGSGSLRGFTTQTAPDGRVECIADFAWESGRAHALSFAYSHRGLHVPLANVQESYMPDAGSPASHLRRVRVIEAENNLAVQRHLDTCRLWTPDAFITDGAHWAKINQLKDYQEYSGGPGFSNNPPSDVFVGRDTFWFLVSSNYYAQAWSRGMLDFWFRVGQEPSGKFIEYMLAASAPLYRDDYGLNINDNTPLLMIAAHHYYALSADRGFLDAHYSALLRAANYILDQRNADGLVWCRSRDAFVRGLCGWRNCTANYRLSGAVTEINSECYRALALMAELAAATGDKPNATRLQAAAKELHTAINRHLQSTTAHNPFYLLMIDPDGKRADDLTGDLLFPALFGVAPQAKARAILTELFDKRFWLASPTGAGGMRTISTAQKGCELKADPSTYGLQGGVWPNLALWAARAASDAGLPDLVVKALRSTRLLADRPDFDQANVTPGEFPEYFNGDDLLQRGAPRSTFIHGSYLWAAWEGLLGLTPHADMLEVNPVLPTSWDWAAISQLPFRGAPLTLLALPKARTLYTTARVKTKWKQIVLSAAQQEKFRLESDAPVFWLVAGKEVLAATDTAATARLIERSTGRVAATLTIPAGKLVRKKFPASAK
jgi:glycogen debranching enzyme